MLTVTSTAFHEKLRVDDDEIILNGPPHDLQGYASFSNRNEETLRIRALPVRNLAKGLKMPMTEASLKLALKIKPGETKLENIWHSVHPQTPPGTYETELVAGGKKSKLKLVVQPNISIQLNPVNFSFQGVVPGGKHNAVITLTNLGNMPFQIPEVKHVTTLDMDYLCRATAIAIRDKGGDGYGATMDELTRNINQNIAGWVSVDLKESGEIVPPGESRLLSLNLVLPKDIDPTRDYSGEIRLWNCLLGYTIKSHNGSSPIKKRHAKRKQ